jgi:hypothetical protein
MKAIRSSETSVLIRATRRHLPEEDKHQDKTHLKDRDDAAVVQILCVRTESIVLFLFKTKRFPENGDRIQSPKLCVLNKKQDMDNAPKHNNCEDTIEHIK